MTTYLNLENLRFYAYHGVMPQEQVVGNEYIVNLRMKVDVSKAMASDEVADTVNYAEVFEAIKKEMEIPSKLIEHVAGRITKRLFKEFPTIEEITLKLSKRNPPMGADIDAAAIECNITREETKGFLQK
ncbi:MAG: dihydroneopterin aldolase [Bacteroides sp.]|nr:dihydroneopterin aldolase [Bacteroides sp.]